MRTVIVAIGGGQWIVVFKEGDDIVRTPESFAQWKDASRAILAWVREA